jgi:Tol biopolymer transport system component
VHAAAVGTFAWSPDGKRLAYAATSSASGRAALHVVDVDGGNDRSLTGLAGPGEGFVWQGSRSLVFIQREAPGTAGRVFAVALDGTRTQMDVVGVDIAPGPSA